jgi:hypothetical protein
MLEIPLGSNKMRPFPETHEGKEMLKTVNAMRSKIEKKKVEIEATKKSSNPLKAENEKTTAAKTEL